MGNGRSGNSGEHVLKVHIRDPSAVLKKLENKVEKGAVCSRTLMDTRVLGALLNTGCATIFQARQKSVAKVSHNNSVFFINLNTSQGSINYSKYASPPYSKKPS